MSSLRMFMLGSGMLGVVGAGYGMWSIISPGEERRKEMLKNLPEGNPIRMEQSRQRNVKMMQVLREAAETNDNIATRSFSPPK